MKSAVAAGSESPQPIRPHSPDGLFAPGGMPILRQEKAKNDYQRSKWNMRNRQDHSGDEPRSGARLEAPTIGL